MLGLGLGIGLWSNQAPNGVAPVVIGFDPTVSNTGITFSNNNQTVADDTVSTRSARVADSHAKTVGSYTGQFTITVSAEAGAGNIGLVDIAQNITANGTALASHTGALSLSNGGSVKLSGADPQGTAYSLGTAYSTGNTVTCRIVNNLVGFAINGVWKHSFDPATGANGVDISVGTNGANGLSNVVPAISINGCTFVLDASLWV